MYLFEKLVTDALENMTVRELSKEIGVPSATISDWTVLGKEPRIRNLKRLAEWSGYPVFALLLEIDGNSLLERIIINLPYLDDEQLQQTVTLVDSLIDSASSPDGLPAAVAYVRDRTSRPSTSVQHSPGSAKLRPLHRSGNLHDKKTRPR